MRLKSDFTEQRNRDILSAYKKILATHDVKLHKDAIRLTINSSAARFYVSAESAAKTLNRIRSGDNLSEIKQHRREMFNELYKRYLECKRTYEFHDKSLSYICTFIVEEPAPKFYLTIATALKLFKAQQKKDICRSLRYY
ncbi:MAG: hypothetical protein RR313_01785 [Anaerovoracaceae bacterium]